MKNSSGCRARGRGFTLPDQKTLTADARVISRAGFHPSNPEDLSLPLGGRSKVGSSAKENRRQLLLARPRLEFFGTGRFR